MVVMSTRPRLSDSRRSTASHAPSPKASCPASSSHAALAVADSSPPSADAERMMMRPHIGSLERVALNCPGMGAHTPAPSSQTCSHSSSTPSPAHSRAMPRASTNTSSSSGSILSLNRSKLAVTAR